LIAAQNTVVAAESLGVGSCYIGDILEFTQIIVNSLKIPYREAGLHFNDVTEKTGITRACLPPQPLE